jgi:hypothetical protein
MLMSHRLKPMVSFFYVLVATGVACPAYLECHAGMLTHAVPIESQFKSLLPDNLNAELVLGTVTNVKVGHWHGP